jgi:glycosyltransferase involved in cell wall biosynthesis
MALEIPTISGEKSGGNVETVGGAGILVDVRNPVLIANAINILLEDTKLQSRLSSLGRKRYTETFEPSRIIPQYELQYEKMLLKWNNQ